MNLTATYILLIITASNIQSLGGSVQFWANTITNNSSQILICEYEKPDWTNHIPLSGMINPIPLKVHERIKSGLTNDVDVVFCARSARYRELIFAGETPQGPRYTYTLKPYAFGSLDFNTPETGSKWILVFLSPKALPSIISSDSRRFHQFRLENLHFGVIRLDKANHLDLPASDLLHDLRQLLKFENGEIDKQPKMKTRLFSKVQVEIANGRAVEENFPKVQIGKE